MKEIIASTNEIKTTINISNSASNIEAALKLLMENVLEKLKK